MSSLVPRFPPSFLSLALRTANDGKLDGAWGTISDSAMNLAARTYHKQYGLRHSKEWPLSKLKWLKILTQRYFFVRICTMMGSLLVLMHTTSCVFKVCMCTFGL